MVWDEVREALRGAQSRNLLGKEPNSAGPSRWSPPGPAGGAACAASPSGLHSLGSAGSSYPQTALRGSPLTAAQPLPGPASCWGSWALRSPAHFSWCILALPRAGLRAPSDRTLPVTPYRAPSPPLDRGRLPPEGLSCSLGLPFQILHLRAGFRGSSAPSTLVPPMRRSSCIF